jgi:hypothetical protein
MKLPGWRTALAAAVALVGLAVPAGAASAATTGGHDHLKPEVFTVLISTKAPDGVVNAYGPVHGKNGTDKQVSDTLDVFVFGKNSVNVRHSPPPADNVKIDYRHCTATQFQKGWWKFDGGTGKYKHASGHGWFKLVYFAVLQRDKHGKCDTNPNDEPKYFKVTVFGWGKASAGHGHK